MPIATVRGPCDKEFMSMRARCWIFVLVVLAAGSPARAQNAVGRLEGRIVRDDGSGVASATALIVELKTTTITAADGSFAFPQVASGTYTLAVTLGTESITIPKVTITAGMTTAVHEVVKWTVGFREAVTVGVSRGSSEPVIESSAAVSVTTATEIAAQAMHGQLPKLAEHMPGAELTQSGVYDFNFNSRGFNSSLTRRVAVLIDGRNPSDPFFAAQEWSAISFPLDDLARLELIRGPSAALYGANASSGILNMVSKDPRSTPGGFVRFTFGQLDTTDLDFRWAAPIGGKWFFKAVGGVRRSEDFFFSRTTTTEYSTPCPTAQGDCLPLDRAAPPRLNDNRIFFGGLRFDRQIDANRTLTFEGGIADLAGPVVQTGVGRVQQTDTTRPWARFNADLDGITLLAAYTGRLAPGQFALNANSYSTLKTHRGQFEGQQHHSFTSARINVVAGASAVVEHIDSFDQSRDEQTVVFEPVTEHTEALFGQADWAAVSKLRLVFAGRVDFSSLHETRFSPKAAAVYTFTPEHSVRVTYNNAFQVPNYSEFFLYADAAPSVDLSALNGVCALSGINCGFGPTRVVAVGNRDLELEEIQTFEVGYKGLLSKRTFVTLDYHRSKAENFITDLLPQLGTSLGRINPDYGPWQAPAGLPESSAAFIRAQAPLLSNAPDGSNVLAAVSYTNIGRVDTQGIDLGVASQWPGGWRSSLSYSWFDYELQDPPAGLERVLLPNTPGHAASAGIDYVAERFSAGLSVRWVDRFRWAVGVFQGDVQEYTTANVTAHYRLTKALTLGLNIANVFDDRHWESFGGDLLRRRALGSVMYGW